MDVWSPGQFVPRRSPRVMAYRWFHRMPTRCSPSIVWLGPSSNRSVVEIIRLVMLTFGQVQNVLSDAKSQELYEFLRRDRELVSPTTQDQINARRNTERVVGPDENIFRIDWVSRSQLLRCLSTHCSIAAAAREQDRDSPAFWQGRLEVRRFGSAHRPMAGLCPVICIGKHRAHSWLVSASHEDRRTSEHKGCLHEVIQDDHFFASKVSLLIMMSLPLTLSLIDQGYLELPRMTCPTSPHTDIWRSRSVYGRIGSSSSPTRRTTSGALSIPMTSLLHRRRREYRATRDASGYSNTWESEKSQPSGQNNPSKVAPMKNPSRTLWPRRSKTLPQKVSQHKLRQNLRMHPPLRRATTPPMYQAYHRDATLSFVLDLYLSCSVHASCTSWSRCLY